MADNSNSEAASSTKKYIVSFKDGLSDKEIDDAKKHIEEDQGGKIVHTYSLIKAVVVEFPADNNELHAETINSTKQHSHIKDIEADQEMHTMTGAEK